MNEGEGSGSGGCCEELELRVWIVVACAAGWAGAIAKALASEKIGWVGPPGDMHDAVTVLILGQ